MKEYLVLKDFQDRFADMKIRRAGETHTPPTKERAEQLLSLGFIGELPERKPEHPGPAADESEGDEHRIKHVGGGYWELPNGEKVKGKDNALEALKALDAGSGSE